jgi:hypothetical protein
MEALTCPGFPDPRIASDVPGDSRSQDERNSMPTMHLADTERQTAGGKVLWHFTMSLDGFVAGPNRSMDWMDGSNRPA